MQLYIECLLDRVRGGQHGSWLELTEELDEDEVMEFIQNVLDTSPESLKSGDPAEEWTVTAYENCPDLGEYPDHTEIATLCSALEYNNAEVIEELCAHFGNTEGLRIILDEEYAMFDSRAEVIEGWYELNEVQPHVVNFIDEEAVYHSLTFDNTMFELSDDRIISVSK